MEEKLKNNPSQIIEEALSSDDEIINDSRDERRIGAASLVGYGEEDENQDNEKNKKELRKTLSYGEVCELYSDVRVYENERDFSIPDFSKYGAKLTYMIPKNFQFKIDERGKIESPLSAKWKNEFEAKKVDPRINAGLIYGDFWMSRNGKPCFRVAEDSTKANHALIETDWNRIDDHDLCYLPSIKNSGLVYFHRAKSNSGSSGCDYLIVPTEFLETGNGGAIDCEEEYSPDRYNPEKDCVVSDVLTYFGGELICVEKDKATRTGRDATEAVLQYLNLRTYELDPINKDYLDASYKRRKTTGVPEIDEVLMKNYERNNKARELNKSVGEKMAEEYGMEYYKQIIGEGSSLMDIKERLLFPPVDDDWVNMVKNYSEAIKNLPKRTLDIDNLEKLPDVEEYRLNIDVPEGKSSVFYGTYVVDQDEESKKRYLTSVWVENLDKAQLIMNESNRMLADFIENENNLKRALEDEEARERGEKEIDDEKAMRVRRHLEEMMELPTPEEGFHVEVDFYDWEKKVQEPIKADFKDGCDFNIALREVFDKKFPPENTEVRKKAIGMVLDKLFYGYWSDTYGEYSLDYGVFGRGTEDGYLTNNTKSWINEILGEVKYATNKKD